MLREGKRPGAFGVPVCRAAADGLLSGQAGAAEWPRDGALWAWG